MYTELFDKFLTHHNTLQVYKDNKLVFASDKERLLPLMEYIDRFSAIYGQVTLFDKIVGRAAALLCAKANCIEVYSPLGSELAVKALNQYGIKHHLVEIVPYINNTNQDDMCPMEKLSLGKDPEEFYKASKNLIDNSQNRQE